MSPVVVCETVAGLFQQIGIVVLVTVWIECWLGNAKSIGRLWTTGNALASSRRCLPTWTAGVLHDFGIKASGS